MASTNFQQAARELKALQGALRAVGEHTKNVSRELVGGLESAVLAEIDVFHADIQRRLDDSTAKIQRLNEFLADVAGGSSAKTSPKPGRPTGVPTKRKKGKRGVRVTISKEELLQALGAVGDVKTKAAELLGVSVPTFNKKLKEAGIVSAGGRRGRKPGPKATGAKAERPPRAAKKKAAKKKATKKKATKKK